MTARLQFGYNQGIPEGHETAWGCRAIVTQTGSVDVPWDRADAVGPDKSRRDLLSYLWDHVGESWKAEIMRLLVEGKMQTRAAEEFVVYDDGMMRVLANTNASAGYCYVVAFWVQERF
jgi:hypothetical protein